MRWYFWGRDSLSVSDLLSSFFSPSSLSVFPALAIYNIWDVFPCPCDGPFPKILFTCAYTAHYWPQLAFCSLLLPLFCDKKITQEEFKACIAIQQPEERKIKGSPAVDGIEGQFGRKRRSTARPTQRESYAKPIEPTHTSHIAQSCC